MMYNFLHLAHQIKFQLCNAVKKNTFVTFLLSLHNSAVKFYFCALRDNFRP